MLADSTTLSAYQKNVQQFLSALVADDPDELNSNVTWQPDPRNAPQCLAYELASQVDEMGYGGQAGGGKSDLALGLAGTIFHRSLILRKEFPNLRRLIERGNEIYPEYFVGNPKNEWRFEGRIITLGSVQHEKDWSKYQGWDSELLAVDEAAEAHEMAIRKISGWVRSSKGRHTLLLLLFNPPTTPEGQWIVKKFAPWIDPEYPGTPAKSGEIRYFVQVDDTDEIEVQSAAPYIHNGKEYLPIRRTFIKASRFDNPYLNAEYERRLNALPEPLRTQVRDGDFTVGMQDDRWQVIPTSWVLAAQERWKNTSKPAVALRAVGVDVAHGGADRTSIAKLYGTWFDEIISYPGVETPRGADTANLVLQAMGNENAVIGIDAVGYGASAAEYLEDAPNLRIMKINAGSGSDALDKSGKFAFANLRAEMIWKFREALDPENEENICLPPSRRLRVQLCSMRYQLRSGKYFIEPKEDIRDRTGESPDDAESIIHGWHAANTRPMRPYSPTRKPANRSGLARR